MSRAAELEARLERIEQQRIETEQELARLENRPVEPVTNDDGEHPVIRFDVQFQSYGAVYSYAAIRTNDRWYTTGPKSASGYSWDELMGWLEGMHWVDRLWLVRSYEEV